MKRLVLLSISMLLIFFCEFKGNIYNPGDSAYKQPSFTLDTSSNVSDGDTILTDTLRMVLIGNDKERHYNLFRYSLDGSSWTKWKGKGEKEYVIEHSPITGGFHTVTIEYCYPDQEDRAKDSTITFFRAVKPEITEMTDTLFDVELGVSCTLRVAAQGTGDLGYEWFCDNNRIDSATSDSLFLNPVFVEDTAHRWYCSISNNWGEITSPEIRLQILLRVFYDGNGNTSGEVPEDTGRYAINGLVEIQGNPGKLTRRGYTFKGWNTEEDGSGVSPDSGLMLKFGTENITLYARWQPNDSFTVTYDGNGAQEGEVPETERYYKTGELVTVAGNSGDLRREGFTFIGWNTLANDSGKGYLEGDTFEMEEKNVILYAQWTSNPAWKVIYDANGAESGNVPEDENKYEEGDTVTVASNSGNLEKEDATFTGWNTEEDGSGTSYGVEESFIIGDKNVTLYAQWSTNPTCRVMYNGNGNTDGEVPTDANNYTEGATVTIKSNSGSLVRTGFSFIGWNVKDDGSGKSYTPGATFTMSTSDVTLYAQWCSNPTFTVTYDGNGNTGGEAPEDDTKYEEGMSVTVKDNTGDLVKTGSSFTGWNTEADGSGDSCTADATIVMGTANLTLYAQWSTKPTFTVTYDGNGNTSGTVPADGTNYEKDMTITVKENTGNLMKTGSTFTGWNTKEDGSGTSYTAGATLTMGTKNLTLYAQWSTNPTFTVTYDGNGNSGGTVPVDGTNYEEGTSVTIKGNTGNLAKTGFTFAGWNTAADGSGTGYNPAATLEMGSRNLTLYAQWTLIPTYTVLYDGNGNTNGTVPSDAIDYEEGTTVTVKANTGDLARGGYTFTGWNTAADGSGTDRAPEATFEMGSADVTLYARWSQNPVYNVIYDGNGSTGGFIPTDENNYEQDMEVTVLGAGNLTRNGYSFTGWNTAGDGSGTAYAADETFAMGTDDVTLYAMWDANENSITFNKNDDSATGTMSAQSLAYGSTANLMLNLFTKAGWTFEGWATSAAGTVEYSDGDEYAMGESSVTLYAIWSANTYTITFNKNDVSATGTMEPQNIACGSAASLTGVGFSKPGWNFTGWATSATGSAVYADAVSYTMGPGNMTLYAVWDANANTITFDKNDSAATGNMPPQTISSGSSADLTPNGFSKEGWTFAGWATSASGAVVYGDGEIYSMDTASVTLYAKWTRILHKVTFDKNDVQATGAMAQQSIGEGTAAVLTSNAFTKTGWTFAGWATTSGGPVAYSNGASYTMGASDVTLYAKWTQITHTITFDKNNAQATGTMSNQTIGEGSTISLAINTFTKTGWSFVGWATSASGTAVYADGDDYTMGTANVTLYAKWTANPFRITFSKNDLGASGNMDPQTILSGSSAPLKPNAFSKSGWTFEGWATSSSGSKVYNDQESYTMGTSNVTLYAKWTPNYYRITFNKNNGDAGGVMSSQSIASGSTAKLSTNSYWDYCKTFVGWATTPTGSAQYSDGGNYTMGTSDVTLYAKWTVTPISVTLANGTTKQHCITDPITCMTNNGGCATYEWYFQAFAGPTLITPSMTDWSGCTTKTLTVNTTAGMKIWCVITDLNGNKVTTGTWQCGAVYCD